MQAEKAEAKRLKAHKEEYHQERLVERTCLCGSCGDQRKRREELGQNITAGNIILLFGRGSGLMSPSRIMHSGCRRSTKFIKLERLIRPTGKRRARMRAGAMGDRESIAMTTSGNVRDRGL
jgi:hypothetical protein